MEVEKILKELRRLKVETGSLACLGCGHENSCSTKGCAVIREAIDALQETLNTWKKALTLEQLKEMVGEPVWVERNEAPHDGKWHIVRYADTENPDKTLYTKDGVTYSDYGTYFTAYANQTVRVNQEKYRPCELCGSLGEEIVCRFSKRSAHDDSITSRYTEAKYCPECGRMLKNKSRGGQDD